MNQNLPVPVLYCDSNQVIKATVIAAVNHLRQGCVVVQIVPSSPGVGKSTFDTECSYLLRELALAGEELTLEETKPCKNGILEMSIIRTITRKVHAKQTRKRSPRSGIMRA